VKSLKAWIVLPADFTDGRQYPLVICAYLGFEAGDSPPYWARVPSGNLFSPQLLAARGYAVLLPSMPIAAKDGPRDPYMDLLKGVMPAVDQAINSGLADPKRLAVVGHSFGGFSVYGLVTLTDRFQAAIASAGMSDFISLYGTFNAQYRYQPPEQQDYLLNMQSFTAEEQPGLAAPPWRDLARYLRNSPLFFVDRVHTPILIVQGDLDPYSITQGEEFYGALHKQGKRARFIRYWGEGHVLTSPANIRHCWEQIYTWLAEFLDVSPASADKSPTAPPN
jgi:dipeptidyl aminopeptidase/acylaminoacyl peptidase